MRRPACAIAPSTPAPRQRGVLVHALIERLPAIPADRRAEAARAFVAARAGGLDATMRAAIVADALAVIEDERLTPLFAADALAEAPVSGLVSVGEAGARVGVTGQIDRLAIGEDAIWFADFKTSARPPDPDKPLFAALSHADGALPGAAGADLSGPGDPRLHGLDGRAAGARTPCGGSRGGSAADRTAGAGGLRHIFVCNVMSGMVRNLRERPQAHMCWEINGEKVTPWRP